MGVEPVDLQPEVIMPIHAVVSRKSTEPSYRTFVSTSGAISPNGPAEEG